MNLFQELRLALRRLRRRPLLALLAVSLLAVGLGGNLALDAALDAILFRQAPVASPDRLVRIVRTDARHRDVDNWSYPNADDLRRDAKTLADAAIYVDWLPFHLSVANRDAIRLQGSAVTGNYFDLLGARAVAGRLLEPADDDAGDPAMVAVLSYDLWRTRFASAPAVVGSEVVVDGKRFTVVGVAPRGLGSLDPTLAPQLWVPISSWTTYLTDESRRDLLTQRGSAWLDLLARIAPGVTVEAVQAELGARIQALAEQFPDELMVESGEGVEAAHAWVMPVSLARVGGPDAAPLVRRQASLIAAIGALLLIVVAANLAALLTARATQARHETAVRAALGASRLRLAQPLLLEGVLLTLAGAALALPFAAATAALARRAIGFVLPLAGDANLDLAGSPRLLAAGLALLTATALLVGAVPGLAASRFSLVPTLRREVSSRPGARLTTTDLLVGGQVALSIVLLVLATLLIGRFRSLSQVDPGFAPQDVVQASFDLGLQGYSPDRRAGFYDELMTRAQKRFGESGAALTDWAPLAGGWSRTSISPAGYQPVQGEIPNADVAWVSPEAFQVLGVRLAQGRNLSAADRADAAPVAVINATMARRYFPQRNPIGATFRRGRDAVGEPPITVVGVIADARYRNLASAMPAMFFQPLAQRRDPPTRMTVLARGANPVATLAGLREILRALDPDLPLYRTGSLRDQIAASLADERRAATLFSGFAVLVLAIAAAGLAALALAAVMRRRREIGIRVALGARAGAVLGLLLQRLALLVAGGAAGGLALAALVLPRLRELAGATAELRPGSILISCGLLAVAAAAATWLPARRALSVDPAETLRAE